MKCRQLTSRDRYALSVLRKQGYCNAAIARAMGRHRSTIGRELKHLKSLAHGVILWYNYGMKTAISLPDDLFESADQLAQDLGMSRSELYAHAVEEFLAKHRDQDVTAKLNEVYGDETSGIDPALRTAQARSVRSAQW